MVGASAFNSFVITAFCVVSLPAGQVKSIRKLKVFWTTTAFSLAAYAWLYLMLNVLSPNVVTIWEAAVTLLLFPAMVASGYLAEKSLFLGGHNKDNEEEEERDSVVVVDEGDDLMMVTTAEDDGHKKWSAQITEAFKVDDDEHKSLNLCSHFFTFFWKVVFSVTIPPAYLLGGWPTLLCSILWIALLTGLMGDLASSFGCALRWDMHTTSITVVAVGTSLPDLFASRVAAKKERFADDAIGNINGSNAYNIFFGLGFPWLCAAVYHRWQGTTFQVGQLDDLSFSVRLFMIFSALQLLLMTARRKCRRVGGELGGPRLLAWLSFAALIALWLLYIVLSIVR